jgi:hypothetical protein
MLTSTLDSDLAVNRASIPADNVTPNETSTDSRDNEPDGWDEVVWVSITVAIR